MPLPNQPQQPPEDDEDDEQADQPESPEEGDQEADAGEPQGLVAAQQQPKGKDKKKPEHKGASKSAVHPDEVLKHMGPKIPPQFQQGFIGAVKSVMQFVTDPRTHKYFLQALAGPGPIAQKLSEGVQHLIAIVAREAKGKFPPQMLIPVGIYAISWVADYANRAGLIKAEESDIALADQMFMHDVMNQLKSRMQGQSPIGRAQQAGAGAGPPAGGAAGGQPTPQPGPALPKMTAAPAAAPGSQPNLGPGAAPGPQMTPPPRMG